ncbi:two-component system chemotaxis response regulator CheY [Rhizomicrobium palustre]|uniref:Two-component system chemotaxis response regulator CheY n=1 Tax=Rhizomicrobium palustre TaxID=189966 RepID=A0A846N2B5_9PROT|nr:response regulator [Rhizomicrobium palustre]NIK89240.1 two-component system chemotaxis response regulator CheY [Rhizomicrobium palustre]
MPSPNKIKAVVVDDQLTMRTLVRSCLQQIGLTDIREFPKAPEALAAMKAAPAHIIFSDFNMPEMDGLEFLRSVRADPAIKGTGFILLTGRADADLVKRAAQFGANNYLVKPFTVAILKQKLEQIFGALS